MSQYSLSVLCHFVALADCIRSGYIGGQLVITRNIFVLLLLPFICILLSVLLLLFLGFHPCLSFTGRHHDVP